MSDSRLEKFIYAICSMDVSDLPVPLSRIEKLWNCLITGETPDFEPLSRNEKYLMAMLDRYDISNLPAPMSRGEKLLYKIAVGETDLSDVPGYLSRYEELLKYLIENGGISGGDFEYVLYTLNQSLHTLYTTAEKPVKSAILTGQTLVNLVNGYTQETTKYGSIVTINRQLLKTNTRYLIIIWNNSEIDRNLYMNEHFFTNWVSVVVPAKGVYVDTNTTKDELPEDRIELLKNGGDYSDLDTTNDFKVVFIEYQQGMENWDIPYFEGMQSVKMPVLTTTGKNLFDIENTGFLAKTNINGQTMYRIPNGKTKEFILNNNKLPNIKVSLNCYTESGDNSSFGRYVYTDGTEEYMNPTTLTSDASKSIYAIHFYDWVSGRTVYVSNVMVSEDVATYEPYKSNILTVNEEVELHGIGDVKDTLDCLTGELTQRIGEDVLDGSQSFTLTGTPNQVDTLCILFRDFPKIANGTVMSDKLIKESNYDYSDFECITQNIHGIAIRLLRNKLESMDKNGVEKFLSQNPITVQYELETESIKTVDLTVVDQDNQPTQLGTFENITHVSLEAENLIPEVEMEVATNLLEDTVFTLTDAFNTLYPTAEKPVKSANLKGQTLVNTAAFKQSNTNASFDNATNVITLTDSTGWIRFDETRLKPSTKYMVVIDILECTLGSESRPLKISLGDGSLGVVNITNEQFKVGRIITTQTTPSTILTNYFNAQTRTDTSCKFKLMVIEYQEGMENWDIPYFEGMQSVKMPVLKTTGKNLFDIKQTPSFIKYVDYNIDVNNGAISITQKTDTTNGKLLGFKVYLKKGKTYTYKATFHNPSNNKLYLRFRNEDKTVEHMTSSTNIVDGNCTLNFTWNQNNGFGYVFLYNAISGTQSNLNSVVTWSNIQFEEGSVATSYEPYKSNILTVNEDIELRGIGDVKDTLDCLTGEVTERVGEIVLDGSENWKEYVASGTSLKRFVCEDKILNAKTYNEISNILPNNGESWTKDITNLSIDEVKKIVIQFNSSDSRYNYSLDEFKQWLSQNPITVQYQLETESVKTVDLTVVDQDSNETKLRTFDNTTHVLLQSEAGPNPTAELTVRTKIPSASSTSLLMDDISTNQQQLETTVDEQSNNVDATMIATTEIFEETL